MSIDPKTLPENYTMLGTYIDPKAKLPQTFYHGDGTAELVTEDNYYIYNVADVKKFMEAEV